MTSLLGLLPSPVGPSVKAPPPDTPEALQYIAVLQCLQRLVSAPALAGVMLTTTGFPLLTLVNLFIMIFTLVYNLYHRHWCGHCNLSRSCPRLMLLLFSMCRPPSLTTLSQEGMPSCQHIRSRAHH